MRRVVPALLVVARIAIASDEATAATEFTERAPLDAAGRAPFNTRVFTAAWDAVHEHYFEPEFHGIDWPAMLSHPSPVVAPLSPNVRNGRPIIPLRSVLKNPLIETGALSALPFGQHAHEVSTPSQRSLR